MQEGQVLATADGEWLTLHNLRFGDAITVRSLPGARYKAGSWRLPQTWTHAKSLRYAFGPRLEYDEQFLTWAMDTLEHRVRPTLDVKDALDTDFAEFKDLYPYQQVGVEFLEVAESCILADEPGTGKTVQVCAALEHLQASAAEFDVDTGPHLIICPNAVVQHWVRHVEDWTSFKPLAIKGSAAQRKKLLASVDAQTVAIINWEGVKGHTRLAGYSDIALRRCAACRGDDSVTPARCEAHPKELNQIDWVSVVADEAHKLAHPKSKQTRAVWAVAHQPSVRYRWALTGTPLTNHLADLWSVLHFIRPLEFSSRTQFIDHFCLSSYNAWGGLEITGLNPQHEAEFKEIFAPLMRRVLKVQVLPQLPKKLRMTRTVQMTKEQRRMYQELDSKLMTKDEQGNRIFAVNDMTAGTRLLQLSSASIEVQADDSIKLVEPSPKLDALMEFLEEDQEDSIIVFAQSRQLLELLQARLDKVIESTPGPLPWQWSYATHYGLGPGYSQAERDKQLALFQDGKRRLLLTTLQSGSVGLNLTVARVAAFLQRSWSMVDVVQAEDRFHRPGAERHDNLLVVDFVAEDTVEADQIDAINSKLRYLEEITEDEARIAKLMAQDLLDRTDV